MLLYFAANPIAQSRLKSSRVRGGTILKSGDGQVLRNIWRTHLKNGCLCSAVICRRRHETTIPMAPLDIIFLQPVFVRDFLVSNRKAIFIK